MGPGEWMKGDDRPHYSHVFCLLEGTHVQCPFFTHSLIHIRETPTRSCNVDLDICLEKKADCINTVSVDAEVLETVRLGRP